MNRSLVVLLALAALSIPACGPAVATEEVIQLPSGLQVKVRQMRPVELIEGGQALLLKYRTDRDIEDVEGLNAEIQEIWGSLQKNAERMQLNCTLIRATTNEARGWEMVGGNYQVVFRRSSDGSWQSRPDPDFQVEEVR